MGYYTKYKLELSDKTIVNDLLKEELAFGTFGEIFEDYGSELSSNDTMKWYDHENDMLQISRKYPDVIFTLAGEGEESGDVWKKYFCAGQVQRAPAKISFDPCRLKVDAKAKQIRLAKKKEAQIAEKQNEIAALEKELSRLRNELSKI